MIQENQYSAEDGPGFSTFLREAGDNRNEFQEFDAIAKVPYNPIYKHHSLSTTLQLSKDHNKFQSVLAHRLEHTKSILHWWNSGNVKSALNHISL